MRRLDGKQKAPNGSGCISRGYRVHRRGKKLNWEHVLVVERVIGRKLKGSEEVHHVNGIKDDNRNENLVVCPDRAYHMLLHLRSRALESCGHADWRRCTYCREWDHPSNLHIGSSTPRHTACHTEYERNRRNK